MEIVTANLQDTRIILVVLEQFFAIGEEARIGDAVVFEDDGAIDMSEHPS